jgi:predicted ribosomally synthesized peptide with nif11-like leader
MSQEAVVDFFQTLEKNPTLSQRLTAIEDPAEVVKIAKSELGYDFTTEELNSAVAAINKSQDGSQGELSEEQLESVAGGLFDNWKISFKGW